MYRRLAEAVEGYSGGEQPVWFVLDTHIPHNLMEYEGKIAFQSEAEAEAALEALYPGSLRWEILGPCVGEATPQRFQVLAVRYMDLTTGEVVEKALPPGCDMLCWSVSAFDKFFAPYYADLSGFDDQGRRRVGVHREKMKTTGFFLHIWPTIGRGFGVIPGDGNLPLLDAGTTLDQVPGVQPAKPGR
jgi:hypothetical protein